MMTNTAKTRPVLSLNDDTLQAAIWENKEESGPFYSVTLTRSYKDEKGAYHDTQSFRRSDLLRLAKLIDKADSEIMVVTLAARTEVASDKAGAA